MSLDMTAPPRPRVMRGEERAAPVAKAVVRAARDALTASAMNCACGSPSTVAPKFSRPSTDGGMGTLTRERKCNACDAKWRTVEIRADELTSLRVAAAMHFLNLSPRAPE